MCLSHGDHNHDDGQCSFGDDHVDNGVGHDGWCGIVDIAKFWCELSELWSFNTIRDCIGTLFINVLFDLSFIHHWCEIVWLKIINDCRCSCLLWFDLVDVYNIYIRQNTQSEGWTVKINWFDWFTSGRKLHKLVFVKQWIWMIDLFGFHVFGICAFHRSGLMDKSDFFQSRFHVVWICHLLLLSIQLTFLVLLMVSDISVVLLPKKLFFFWIIP